MNFSFSNSPAAPALPLCKGLEYQGATIRKPVGPSTLEHCAPPDGARLLAQMAQPHLISLLVSVVLARGITCAAASPPVELEVTNAWSVWGPDRFDASGLAKRNDELFVVSDRHNDRIFRLVLSASEARAEVTVTFSGPHPYPEKGYLDLEGLALAPDGGFLVAAEWGFAAAHVPAGGGQATWVTPNVRAAGEAVGLFATRDAFIEGLAVLRDGSLLLAVERQPRGLIEVTGGLSPTRVCAQNLDASHHPIPAPRKYDFGDLCVWRDRVFALGRNQQLVVELLRAPDGAWTEGEAWSYATTENAAPHRFVDMTFGQGEGLAIDDAFIYVLIDNNHHDRAGHPGDKRSWLFAFRNVIGAAR
jgi:hypothetical protein